MVSALAEELGHLEFSALTSLGGESDVYFRSPLLSCLLCRERARQSLKAEGFSCGCADRGWDGETQSYFNSEVNDIETC